MRRTIEVAVALIERDGLVLLDRRKKGTHLEDHWEFPGGKREASETFQEAVLREVQEELGVAARTTGEVLLTVHHGYADFDVALHVLPVELLGEPFAADVAEIRWVTADELLTLRMPPADKPLVELAIGRNAASRGGADNRPVTG